MLADPSCRISKEFASKTDSSGDKFMFFFFETAPNISLVATFGTIFSLESKPNVHPIACTPNAHFA